MCLIHKMAPPPLVTGRTSRLVTPLIWILLLPPLVIGQAGRLGCGLQLVTSPLLWSEEVTRVEREGLVQERREVDMVARHNLVSLASRLVNAANGVLDNYFLAGRKYELVIQDISVLKAPDCQTLGADLCSTTLPLPSLLDQFSRLDHSRFCLSYLLTDRSFPGGLLGLAWTAALDGSGGVCEKHRLHSEELIGGYQVAVNKSLNTGVVTLRRLGERVSEQVAALAFTHEVVHSLGASHDTEGECNGGSGGTFLMYPTGSLGLRPHNMQLSPCSTRSLASLLHTRTSSTSCWQARKVGNTCGNSVVEGWEHCDCGSDPDLCRAACCVPSTSTTETPCTLVAGAECSPTEGVCCDSQCKFSPPSQQCAMPSECASLGSSCDGDSALCPVPLASKEEGTLCAGESRTCVAGRCEGSVCQGLGLLPCSAPQTNNSAEACQPHCQTFDGVCSALNSHRNSYPAGTECEMGGGFGHCDSGGYCNVETGSRSPVWVTGLVIFLICYFILSSVFMWVYCRYCKGNRDVDIEIRRKDEIT